MGQVMDLEKWNSISKYRSDMTTTLTHLTRPIGKKNEVDILLDILEEETIRGNKSSEIHVGNDPVVSFTESPILSVAEFVIPIYEYCIKNKMKPRFAPCGLSFTKRYSYIEDANEYPGARPVIYEQKTVAMQILKKSEYWRVVPLDLSKKDKIIDWTHQREWRVKGDFEFDIEKVTVLLYDGKQYREFLSKAEKRGIDISELNGIICLKQLIY